MTLGLMQHYISTIFIGSLFLLQWHKKWIKTS